MALDGTYAGLQASIAAYMHRSDLTAVIPDFIKIAEARIARDLRIRQMIQPVSINTVAGTSTIALPTGFLAFENIYVAGDSGGNLSYATSEWLSEKFPDSSFSGTPGLYTIEGTNAVLAPTPDGIYTIAGSYYKQFDSLVAASTNWLLINRPYVYLYSALVEASIYAVDPARAQVYEGKYQAAIAETQSNDTDGKYSGSVLSVKAM